MFGSLILGGEWVGCRHRRVSVCHIGFASWGHLANGNKFVHWHGNYFVLSIEIVRYFDLALENRKLVDCFSGMFVNASIEIVSFGFSICIYLSKF